MSTLKTKALQQQFAKGGGPIVDEVYELLRGFARENGHRFADKATFIRNYHAVGAQKAQRAAEELGYLEEHAHLALPEKSAQERRAVAKAAQQRAGESAYASIFTDPQIIQNAMDALDGAGRPYASPQHALYELIGDMKYLNGDKSHRMPFGPDLTYEERVQNVAEHYNTTPEWVKYYHSNYQALEDENHLEVGLLAKQIEREESLPPPPPDPEIDMRDVDAEDRRRMLETEYTKQALQQSMDEVNRGKAKGPTIRNESEFYTRKAVDDYERAQEGMAPLQPEELAQRWDMETHSEQLLADAEADMKPQEPERMTQIREAMDEHGWTDDD
jgi:hypothetical protein